MLVCSDSISCISQQSEVIGGGVVGLRVHKNSHVRCECCKFRLLVGQGRAQVTLSCLSFSLLQFAGPDSLAAFVDEGLLLEDLGVEGGVCAPEVGALVGQIIDAGIGFRKLPREICNCGVNAVFDSGLELGCPVPDEVYPFAGLELHLVHLEGDGRQL